MHDAIMKILAELIIISALNLLPFRRLKSIDGTLKGLRRDLRRVIVRVDRHERRLDDHDGRLGVNTKNL